jgi:hypothetical protein
LRLTSSAGMARRPRPDTEIQPGTPYFLHEPCRVTALSPARAGQTSTPVWVKLPPPRLRRDRHRHHTALRRELDWCGRSGITLSTRRGRARRLLTQQRARPGWRRGTRAPLAGIPWTKEEDELARTLKAKEVVERTGRTLSAVYSRRRILGLADGRAGRRGLRAD